MVYQQRLPYYFHLKSTGIAVHQSQQKEALLHQTALESLDVSLPNDQNASPNILGLHHLVHGKMFSQSHLYHVPLLEYPESRKTSYLFQGFLYRLRRTNDMFGYHPGSLFSSQDAFLTYM